ncbi:flexirubin biosynthesis protein DarG [Sphingobacterium hungaricum]
MKKSEVPQDKGSVSEKGSRELYYALDENGEYTTELSTGWEPKQIVQNHTLSELQERINQAQQDVKNGLASPIVYFMELKRMDWQIVADYSGIWKWRVKRHANPSRFQKLSDKTLSKYAEAFEISLEELKNYKGD